MDDTDSAPDDQEGPYDEHLLVPFHYLILWKIGLRPRPPVYASLFQRFMMAIPALLFLLAAIHWIRLTESGTWFITKAILALWPLIPLAQWASSQWTRKRLRLPPWEEVRPR